MALKRVWHGWTTAELADEYEELLKNVVFPAIEAKAISGYRGIELLRCSPGDGNSHGSSANSEVEFVTIMTFDCLQDVLDFQGPDYETAYVPDAARLLLTRWDKTSRHYEVIESREYT